MINWDLLYDTTILNSWQLCQIKKLCGSNFREVLKTIWKKMFQNFIWEKYIGTEMLLIFHGSLNIQIPPTTFYYFFRIYSIDWLKKIEPVMVLSISSW